MSVADLALLIKETDLDQNINLDQINLAYAKFRTDFIESTFQVNKKNILIINSPSKIKQYDQYPETFVHIITRSVTEGRIYDCNRANRVHWIKPVLLSHPCNDIKYYKWKDDKGVCKEHFWFFAKDFMVVLKDLKADVQIVTAFCVDKQDKLKFYEKFKNFNEGNGNC